MQAQVLAGDGVDKMEPHTAAVRQARVGAQVSGRLPVAHVQRETGQLSILRKRPQHRVQIQAFYEFFPGKRVEKGLVRHGVAGTLLEGEDFGYRLESQLPDMEMSLPLPEFRKVRLGGESSVLEVQAVLQKIFRERTDRGQWISSRSTEPSGPSGWKLVGYGVI